MNITEQHLHDAADAATNTEGPEDFGIDSGALEGFLQSNFIWQDDSPVECDRMSVAYGITVGILAERMAQEVAAQ